MKILKLIYTIFLLSISLNASQKVSLQLDWLHQFQFAGYYMAKEKGYYKEKDIEVEIKEYKKGVNLTKDVLDSKSNYAVGKSSLIIDRLEGKKIILLSAIYQSSPMVLISLEKSNIKKVQDFKGKRVSLTSDARLMASVNSMLMSKGIESKDIKFQEHSFNIEDLINEKTDAMACFLANEPYILDKKGVKYTVHNPSDYGFNFYGGILFTSQKELENNPLRVKKFNEASLKGWKYAFEHIEETANIIFKKYNTQNKSLDSLVYEGKVLRDLSGFKEGLLGNIDERKINELKRLYSLLSLNIDFKSNINDLIYDPLLIYLTRDEINYLTNNTISLLSNNDFKPMAFVDENNKMAGIEIEYWKLINQKLKNVNSKIKLIKTNEEALNLIKNNKNAIKYSFSSLDNNDFISKTNSIFSVPLALITLKNKLFVPNISDLENRKIAIHKNAAFYSMIKNKYPNLKFVETNSIEEALNLVLNGEVFGFVEKLPRLSYLVSTDVYPNLKISGTFKEKYQARISVYKNNPILKNIINKAILSINEEERKKINSKYYYVIYETAVSYEWLYKILVPLLIVLVIIIISNRKLKKEIKKRKMAEEQLKKIVDLDPLTNTYNRRKIDEILEIELSRVKRYKVNLSVIFLDIDNFKKINDDLGHKIGDEILIKFSKLIKEHIRKTDFLGRWGGEEFVIILSETKKEQAKNVAYLIKEKINAYDFDIDRTVTCSFGVSQFKEGDTIESLIKRVDGAMYDIKRNGKDGIKII
ncbi:MAG: ABC transporter substrate-binding protein [Arcobacter sp.]|nr:ABC transporter substrate-binding protein [Arcobacter sp.]